MPFYYTEYPTGSFFSNNDAEALDYEPDAKLIYKESDTGMDIIRATCTSDEFGDIVKKYHDNK